jgi:hypothetical protein
MNACVNINVFSWSLYAWITNLDFSYAWEVFECFILSTKRKLKIRIFLNTSEIMIISNIWRFNKLLISFRLDSANVSIEMRTKINDELRAKINDESSSSCKNTIISAKFWYRRSRCFVRVSLAEISDARFWSSSLDDWTFFCVDSTSSDN